MIQQLRSLSSELKECVRERLDIPRAPRHKAANRRIKAIGLHILQAEHNIIVGISPNIHIPVITGMGSYLMPVIGPTM